MRSRLIVAAAALLLPLLWPTPALGAWGGELDGNGHPMVGAIYADFDASGTITWDELVCSGSYAGRSKDDLHEVFLTAAHCLAWAPQDGFDTLFVSFDEDPQEGDGIPEGLIGSGSFAWDERWGHDASVGFDVGVVLLPPGSVGGGDARGATATRVPRRSQSGRRAEGHALRARRLRDGAGLLGT